MFLLSPPGSLLSPTTERLFLLFFFFYIIINKNHLWLNFILSSHVTLHWLLFSCSVVFDSSWPHRLQHTGLPCPSPSPRVCWNSCPLSRWWHPNISFSVFPFSCLQSSPAKGFLPMSRLFTSGGQRIKTSASVLPMNIQDWFPLRLTGLISLQSKGLSRIFSSTTVLKHQFFGAQPFLWSNCHIRTWLLEKP